MDEEIKIKIEAEYQQLTNLIDTVNKLTKSFEQTAKNKNEIQAIVDLLEKAEDPIRLANELLAESAKQIDVARKNLEKLVAVGADSASIKQAERQAQKVAEREKFIAEAIKISPAVMQQAERITAEHDLQALKQEAEFKELLAERTRKYDEEELARKQRLEEQQKQIAEKIKQDELAEIQARVEAQKRATQAISEEKFKAFMLSLDPTKQKLAELVTKLSQAKEAFIEFDKAGDSKGLEKTKNQIAKLKKQIEKTEEDESKKKKGGWLSILFGRIRNISIYRTIRSVMKWFTSGIQEGLGNLAQYSSDVNDILSNINASLNQVRSTLAISFASVLKSLEPIISQLSSALVDLINNFNLALAKMQGKNVYLKAKKNVEDYAKSVQKAQKLSFDTFEVLSGSGQTSPFEMFEEGDISKDATQTSKVFEKLLSIVQKLWEVLTKIWTNIIEPAIPAFLGIASGILTIISTIVTVIDKLNLIYPIIFAIVSLKIVKGITSLIGVFKNLGVILTSVKTWFQNYNLQCALATKKTEIFRISAGAMVIALASVAGAIVSCIANWNNMSAQTKGWVIAIGALTAVVASLAFAVYASMQQWAKAISVASGVIATGTTVITAISGFKDGGIPAKSELFYMNENGVPEALMNTGGSQTNVINQQQLRTLVRDGYIEAMTALGMADGLKLRVDSSKVDDNAFARAIFPALKTESTRWGGNQL